MINNTKKHPIIGVSASLKVVETGYLKGTPRAFVGQDYMYALEQTGGVPIILPIVQNIQTIDQQVSLIDGLILSGGYDVHPLVYGEEPHYLLGDTCPLRDDYEIALVKRVYAANKPILGICRGLQLLNVAFGGTLYQDLSLFSQEIQQHSQKTAVNVPTQTVDLVKETLLAHLMGTLIVRTNSFHHQSIKTLAPGFVVNARARDGIIEGIESQQAPFILGLQWHPELMYSTDSYTQQIFAGFVEAARGQV